MGVRYRQGMSEYKGRLLGIVPKDAGLLDKVMAMAHWQTRRSRC